ncbi:MAG TPA: DUF5615 family PIN-like protein [Patescibacteria group bacterium]|nr:DUF5615 family PIN-like protein [Patescibacteria group bacterium]
MKFLADENISKSVVLWLREKGHDVLWIIEGHRQLFDEKILQLALVEKRILLTNDNDFGEFIFRQRQKHRGVVLFRLRNESKEIYLSILEILLRDFSQKLEQSFTVVSENQIRFRK